MAAETLLLAKRPGHAHRRLCRPSLLLLALPQLPPLKDPPGPRLPVEEGRVRLPREQPGLWGPPHPPF